MKTRSQDEELISAARRARDQAYAPYSDYRVGAAIRTSGGAIFSGCNIENSSLGLTICAERVAIAKAVAAGERQFEALAIATSDGATPCGACRQVLAEFSDDLPILVAAIGESPEVRQLQLAALLPEQFARGD